MLPERVAMFETWMRDLRAATADPAERPARLLEQFRFVDLARKVVGVGSVGTRAWIVLLLGRDDSDPLFLQVKEARGVGARAVQRAQPVPQPRRPRRRRPALMQAASDIFLGWQRVEGIDGMERDFYVRQLRDWKGVDRRSTRWSPTGMRSTGLCALDAGAGTRLFRRPRRDRRVPRQERRLRPRDRRLRAAYADQNERDYAALGAAVAAGRIAAETGAVAGPLVGESPAPPEP